MHRRGLTKRSVRMALRGASSGGGDAGAGAGAAGAGGGAAGGGVGRVVQVGAEVLSSEAGALPPAEGGTRHAVEAGLYACSAAVFDQLRELSRHLDYFTLAHAMQPLASEGATSPRPRPISTVTSTSSALSASPRSPLDLP